MSSSTNIPPFRPGMRVWKKDDPVLVYTVAVCWHQGGEWVFTTACSHATKRCANFETYPGGMLNTGLTPAAVPDDHQALTFGPIAKQSVPGRKDDKGKLDMTLLDDMPRALAAVVEVMQWAIEKKQPVPYERSSWLGVHPDRYRAAILRHHFAAAKQTSTDGYPVREQVDHETKLLHLAHEACSAMMALENTLRDMEKDQA